MNQYKTTLEVEITPLYDYTSEEARTYNYPGHQAEVDVWGIEIEGVRLTDEEFLAFWWELPEDVRYEIETSIIEHEQEKARDAAEYRAEELADARAEGSLFEFGAGLMRMQNKLRG